MNEKTKNKPIVNVAEVELQTLPPQMLPTGKAADTYRARMAWISSSLGAQKLGYNLTVLTPGKKAFPAHNHHVNEEMFLVLEGRGTIQIGSETFDIRQGDIIACPPGGRDSAHQITNSGDKDLKYLAISTKESPDVVEYPNSGKFAVVSANSPGGMFRYVGKEEDAHDYWEGE